MNGRYPTTITLFFALDAISHLFPPSDIIIKNLSIPQSPSIFRKRMSSPPSISITQFLYSLALSDANVAPTHEASRANNASSYLVPHVFTGPIQVAAFNLSTFIKIEVSL